MPASANLDKLFSTQMPHAASPSSLGLASAISRALITIPVGATRGFGNGFFAPA
jgi:hypothetical protein